MPQIWIQQLMSVVKARLNIMAYQFNNMWVSHPIAGGAYFYRENWMTRFVYGNHHFPAFHLFMDISANVNSIKCGIRLEETYRNPALIVPPPINAIFPVHLRNNVGYNGNVNWVFDNCVVTIPLPVGFQRNNANQLLTLGLWVDIENHFFQIQQNCLQPFVNFD